MFSNSPGDRGSIPGQVIPKTQKLVLDISLHVSRVKWSNPRKEVAPFPTPRCSRKGKGTFRSPSIKVALN